MGALANLTNVDVKYCSMVEVEGGMELLEELINDQSPTRPYDRVIELATMVRNNVRTWKKNRAAAAASVSGRRRRQRRRSDNLDDDDDDEASEEEEEQVEAN